MPIKKGNRRPPSRSWRAAAPWGLALGLVLLFGPADSPVSLAAVPADGESQALPAPAVPSAPGGSARATLDPRTPTGATRRYIDLCRKGNYAEAATLLDLEDLPAEGREQAGTDLARKFKVVLDRKLWVHFEGISDQPEGNRDDGLPEDVERIGSVGDTDILLERSVDQRGQRVWRFASSTVQRIASLYDEYGYGPLGEILPAAMFEIGFLAVQLWQWIGLIVLAFVAILLSWVVAGLLRRIVQPLVGRTETELDDELLDLGLAPTRALLAVAIFAAGLLPLALSVPAYQTLSGLTRGLAVLGVTWLALRVVDVVSVVAKDRLEKDDRRSAVAVIPLGRRAAKVFLLALALIAILQNLGFNATSLIAGLGVGGLAVALAAQKSLSNLFGGISLITDQPVRVGDFCRFGDGKAGTVEEVGLRSTRIRTLDRTLVTIPNSEFSEIQLENVSARDRIRLCCTLGLRYETTPDQLRFVLAELRRLLAAHPRVIADSTRVRFVSFGAYSLDLEVFAYVDTCDWPEFLKVREDLYLRFLEVVESSGSGFAFPSQTLYMARDLGLPATESRAAEERVRAWRREGRLPFPDFPPEMVAEFEGTLDYPPTGSAGGRK